MHRVARRCSTAVHSSRAASTRTGEWPKPYSPEWLALTNRPHGGVTSRDDYDIPVDVAMGYLSASSSSSLPPKKDAASPPKEHQRDQNMGSSQEREPDKTQTARTRRDGAVLVSKEARREAGVSTPGFFLPEPASAPHVAHYSAAARKMLEFRLTPREVKAALDRRVVGQREAKKAIAVSVSEHYHHARRCLEDPTLLRKHFHKPNMLVFGPSGSGKSHLLRAAAELVSAPFVTADATKFSATGFVGRDVGDVVSQLLEASGDDLDTARFGIVYVDEVDKICDKSSADPVFGGFGSGSSGSVNTRDVQTALLKLMEDFEIPLSATGRPGLLASSTTSTGPPRRPGVTKRDDKNDVKTFSTKHVLFVFSGAFEPGPAKQQQPKKQLKTARDFVDIGLIREFVGRVPVRVALDRLSVDELRDILAADNDVSPLSRYVDAFAAHGIRFTYDTAALDLIARRAFDHDLGARGLLTEVEATLRDFSYYLPSCSGRGLADFHLDADTVADPTATLRRILHDADLHDDLDFDAAFSTRDTDDDVVVDQEEAAGTELLSSSSSSRAASSSAAPR